MILAERQNSLEKSNISCVEYSNYGLHNNRGQSRMALI
jgi:hypothetical protein